MDKNILIISTVVIILCRIAYQLKRVQTIDDLEAELEKHVNYNEKSDIRFEDYFSDDDVKSISEASILPLDYNSDDSESWLSEAKHPSPDDDFKKC